MTLDTPGIRYPFENAPETGEVIEVADGVLWFRLPLPMALDHVNIYALYDGDGWTIIDTGFDTRKTRGIWNDVIAGPLGGKPINRVIITHFHPDHIGLAGWFVEQGAELITTRTTYLTGRMLTLDTQDSYRDETLTFYTLNGMDPEVAERRKSERPFNFSDCVTPIPIGYTRIQDGETIAFGGRTWDIKTGDGHAAEHATFWSKDDNLVLGGDQLLPSISPNIGVYATEPEADPVAEWLASCERFLALADQGQFVLGGHKLPFYGLVTRLEQLIENHHGALDRLHDFIAEPKKGGECFPALFKRSIGDGEYGLAFVETIAHLNHLHQTGRARRWREQDGAYRWQQIA